MLENIHWHCPAVEFAHDSMIVQQPLGGDT